jgi:LacI family transcriptional regulator
MSITIKDIAKQAGVSVTTVSRALNGYPDIKPETRKRILRIAAEANYHPSAIARSLVMKKSRAIGLIISELTDLGSGYHMLFDVIRGVNDQAMALGYDLILSATDPEQQREVPYMELCQRRQLEGVVLMGVRTDDPYLKEVLDASVPCALVDIPLTADSCTYVTLDNVQGAKLAVQHLVERGHRRIGLINGHNQAFVSRERWKGYGEGLKEAGIPLREEWVAYGDFEQESGADCIENLLAADPELTAVFCASDMMAIGAIQRLKQLGKRVPEDVAVVGFDGLELTQFLTPSVTTIVQPRHRFGVEAVNLLVRMMAGETPEPIILDPELREGQSTGK